MERERVADRRKACVKISSQKGHKDFKKHKLTSMSRAKGTRGRLALGDVDKAGKGSTMPALRLCQ